MEPQLGVGQHHHHIAQYGRDVSNESQLVTTTASALNTDAVQGVGEPWHDTIGQHWRGLLQAGGFTVCLVASAGACLAVGLVVAGVTYGFNGLGGQGWGGDNLHQLEVNGAWAFVGYFGASGLGTMIPEGGSADAPGDLGFTGGGSLSAGDPLIGGMGPMAIRTMQGLPTFGQSKAFDYTSNFYNGVFTCGVPQASPGYCG